VPGTRTAGDKAKHILLSLLSAGGLLAVLAWVANGGPGGLLLLCLPLCLGMAWAYTPMLQDVVIAVYLRHEYDHYIYEGQETGRIVRSTQLAHSARYNGIQNTQQKIVLTNPAEVDKLYSTNAELQAALYRVLAPPEETQPLEGLTPDQVRLVNIARKYGNASVRNAARDGLTGPAYIIARDALLQAGILEQAGQSVRLAA
jgi:hypothetical protein